jgi:hypothetical protein
MRPGAMAGLWPKPLAAIAVRPDGSPLPTKPGIRGSQFPVASRLSRHVSQQRGGVFRQRHGVYTVPPFPMYDKQGARRDPPKPTRRAIVETGPGR